MSDDEIKMLYSTNKEIANHYDSNKNITKTMEYSFLVCQEDPLDTVSVTKIVYWDSYFKDYANLIKLLNIIRNNNIQVVTAKQIFYRENKMTLKDFLVKYYVDTLRKKEELEQQINVYILGKNKEPISSHIISFYKLVNNLDIYPMYDEYIKELNIVTEYKTQIESNNRLFN